MPAALGPSLPCSRISRVEATFRESRNRVVDSSRDGKTAKSSGRDRIEGDDQNQQRDGDAQGQKDIEQQWRQGNDHHHQDGHQAEGDEHIAAQQDLRPVLFGQCGNHRLFPLSL